MDKKYIFPIMLFALIVLSFLIIKDYILIMLTATIVAYFFLPLQKRLAKKIHPGASAAVILVLIVVILFLMTSLFLKQLSTEALSIISLLNGNSETVFGKVSELLSSSPKLQSSIETFSENALGFIVNNLTSAIKSLPNIILNFFVFVLLSFYLLRDWDLIIKKIKKHIPIGGKFKKSMATELKKSADAVIYGTVFTALIQGVIALIGYLIFGVENAFVWAFFTFLMAFIPIAGTALVWLPLGVFLIIKGIYLDSSFLWRGIGLLIYGAALIGTIDNFIRPNLITRKTSTHPLLIIIGVFGGLTFFGFVGLLIGPVILSVTTELVALYIKD